MEEKTIETEVNLLGLSEEEVNERIAAGKINGDFNVPTKSIKHIVRSNVLTFFNLLNVVLAATVIFAGVVSGDFFSSAKNCLFMGVIFCNTGIGIFQEVRAKKTIDRLSLISAPKAHVLRDGTECEIAVSQIVTDDLTVLSAGRQICADSVIVEGECELNESLITGESDPVSKHVGDELLSGSLLSAAMPKQKLYGSVRTILQIKSQAAQNT